MAGTSEPINISAVETEPSPALAGGEINLPAPGEALATYALDVRGWAVGGGARVTGVELACEGSLVRSASLDVERPQVAARLGVDPRVGFRTLVNGLALPLEFDLEVAATGDGERAPLGVVRGRRRALPGRPGVPRQPLIVTTLGRTGSMMLLRLLEAHPEILVLRPHRYEQRVAGYWVEVLLALTDPAGYLRQLAPAGSLDRPRWWLGDEGPVPFTDPKSELQRWLGDEAVLALADVCADRIDALYAEAARLDGGAPRYFAEKHTVRSAALTGELYPGAREVFLVRDFRDMVTSILAFNRKRGVRGFGEGATDGAVDYVERLGGWAQSLVGRLRRRGDAAHVVRYEDLVGDGRPTLEALLAYLQVDAGGETVERMARALEQDMPELEQHATSADPGASVGRWRDELDEQLKDACRRSFGTALTAFGYEP